MELVRAIGGIAWVIGVPGTLMGSMVGYVALAVAIVATLVVLNNRSIGERRS